MNDGRVIGANLAEGANTVGLSTGIYKASSQIVDTLTKKAKDSLEMEFQSNYEQKLSEIDPYDPDYTNKAKEAGDNLWKSYNMLERYHLRPSLNRNKLDLDYKHKQNKQQEYLYKHQQGLFNEVDKHHNDLQNNALSLDYNSASNNLRQLNDKLDTAVKERYITPKQAEEYKLRAKTNYSSNLVSTLSKSDNPPLLKDLRKKLNENDFSSNDITRIETAYKFDLQNKEFIEKANEARKNKISIKEKNKLLDNYTFGIGLRDFNNDDPDLKEAYDLGNEFSIKSSKERDEIINNTTDEGVKRGLKYLDQVLKSNASIDFALKQNIINENEVPPINLNNPDSLELRFNITDTLSEHYGTEIQPFKKQELKEFKETLNNNINLAPSVITMLSNNEGANKQFSKDPDLKKYSLFATKRKADEIYNNEEDRGLIRNVSNYFGFDTIDSAAPYQHSLQGEKILKDNPKLIDEEKFNNLMKSKGLENLYTNYNGEVSPEYEERKQNIKNSTAYHLSNGKSINKAVSSSIDEFSNGSIIIPRFHTSWIEPPIKGMSSYDFNNFIDSLEPEDLPKTMGNRNARETVHAIKQQVRWHSSKLGSYSFTTPKEYTGYLPFITGKGSVVLNDDGSPYIFDFFEVLKRRDERFQRNKINNFKYKTIIDEFKNENK
ncbi:hypothetical protein AB832_07515 [Flavobacteriaceae bacterium (ex Bugula neritina AB1)]|nr:hypothetical protein AB832_07515 [Flavobacteriaceae bacterium (ex Bugula neritina AB1)]